MTDTTGSKEIQKAIFPPAPMTTTEQTAAFLQVIKEVALIPGATENMRALLDMQRQLVADQAERAINEALARIDIPHVKKNGKIPLPDKSGNIREVAFAKWEDIDTVIRPLLRAEGLSLSFTAPARQSDGGGASMTGRVSHAQGAFREAQISLPLDTGPGRNNLQAMGSTISYGKKYLTFMLLNIVTENEDDDGAAAEIKLITTEQAADLDTRVRKFGEDAHAKFIAWLKVEKLTDLPVKQYKKAVNFLNEKETQAKKGKAA